MVIFYILSFLEHKAFIWRIPAACTNFLSVHYAPLSNENLTASCICLFFACSQAFFFGVLGFKFLFFSPVFWSAPDLSMHHPGCQPENTKHSYGESPLPAPT